MRWVSNDTMEGKQWLLPTETSGQGDCGKVSISTTCIYDEEINLQYTYMQ